MSWKTTWTTINKVAISGVDPGVEKTYTEISQYNSDLINLLEKVILPLGHDEELKLIDLYIEKDEI